MSDTQEFSITLEQESDYVFRISFDDTPIPSLVTDESPPLGGDAGPNPSRLLTAAVANCLSASLLFALRKFKNTPGKIVTRATAHMARNEHGRLRVESVDATITLPGLAQDYQQLPRVLAQFEDFCIVTESVRAGVAVNVSVQDQDGTQLHGSQPQAPA
ncbi:OsmC family protein [Pseudoxanthomonas wuyuanensis]|uniref:Organic hydroperoxide reductase OsmC/OhrA n=1 Tax=Pseudoxanthomonas wuyuanensis TaxID=1073196 RepID=A0A286CVW4_9GAMM|nr:OsmC family protein [Pseudoxanthomonas wuyuanensis]KAF1721264.1 peroxiredoxin [Pseudoxanthomonas wuyuanensis]SOD50527.1 Organic hydroperoxide reductase OsmC/OhrA [Pseudoxanthomonas wuyuanensis]